MNSLPSRGQTGNPGLPEAKFDDMQKLKKNRRSVEAWERRKSKRKTFRINSRANLKLLKNSYKQQGLSSVEIRSKLKESRRVRKSGVFDPPRLVVDEKLADSVNGKLAKRGRLQNSLSNEVFFNTRHQSVIGTFNTRTLTAKWRRNELVCYCIHKEIEVLAIQEHRIYFVSDDPIRREQFGNGWYFIYSTADSKGGGGVGFLISARVYKFVSSVKSVSPRVMQVNIRDGYRVASCFYSIYSPTSCAEPEVVEEFYNVLSESVSIIPAATILFIMGDFNAMLQVDGSVLFSPNKTENSNSELLVDFLRTHSLVPANTLFQKRRSQVSFYGPKGRHVLLDYILVRTKWCGSVRDCDSMCPAAVASDHKVVAAKIKWRLKNNKNAKSRCSRDLGCLKNSDCAKSVSNYVSSQFYSECTNDPMSDYSLFSRLAKEGVGKFVPEKERVNRRKPWEDPDIERARRELVGAKLSFYTCRSDDNKQRIADCAKSLSELYVQKENSWYANRCDSLMQLSGDHQYKAVWSLVDGITGRKARVRVNINADSAEERVKLWVEHFRNLLSPTVQTSPSRVVHPPVFPNIRLNYNAQSFVMSELKDAIKALGNGKAPGIDDMTNEVLKLEELHPIILQIINKTYETKEVPEEWLMSVLIPIYKKGCASDPGNYRGIALMSACAKLYNRMLLVRVRVVLDQHLRYNQNGFRPLRSTAQHVLSIRRLFETVQHTKDARLVAIFVDFCKAFDSVSWDQMEAILYAYQVPSELVLAIMSLYRGAQAVILDETSEFSDDSKIDLSVGVLQGDTLAPFLFVLVMDFVLRNAMVDSLGVQITKSTGSIRRGSPAKFLTDLDFADDIVLFSSNIIGAQKLLSNLERVALTVGLKINQLKSEYMLVGEWGETKNMRKIRIKAGQLKLVTDYKYLGSWLENSVKDFKTRRDLAWVAHRKLWRIWKSKTITREVKINIFKATIESILLYNATTWRMTEGLQKSLDGAYTKLLRYALNVRWQDRVKNVDLYKSLPKVSVRLRQRRLAFAGHCWRSSQSAFQPVSELLFWFGDGEGNKSSGAYWTYVHVLLKDFTGEREKVKKDNLVVSVSQLKSAMDDRQYWSRVVRKSS